VDFDAVDVGIEGQSKGPVKTATSTLDQVVMLCAAASNPLSRSLDP
jgi:hypothetical protein